MFSHKNPQIHFILFFLLILSSITLLKAQPGGNGNGIGPGFNTTEPAQMHGDTPSTNGDWESEPLFTVGEEIDGYRMPGILDGIGAISLEHRIVRVFVNHELRDEQGYPYTLVNNTVLTGARVSYFDIHRTSRKVIGAGLAYHTVVDRASNVVTSRQPD